MFGMTQVNYSCILGVRCNLTQEQFISSAIFLKFRYFIYIISSITVFNRMLIVLTKREIEHNKTKQTKKQEKQKQQFLGRFPLCCTKSRIQDIV